MGLVGATGLVVATGSEGTFLGTFAPLEGAPAEKICMLSDAPFFADLEQGCYSRSLLDDLYTKDILNRRGDRVQVTMTSPPESAQASGECKNCADYDRMQRLGWFALSNRDQRREEFFRRACSMLEYLRKSSTPSQTFFTEGTLSEDIINAIPNDAIMQIDSIALRPQRQGERQRLNRGWADDAQGYTIELDDHTIIVQPLVHADFDGDDIGDILVYARTRIEGATAFTGSVGYLTRTSETGPVSFHLRDDS